MRRSFAVALIVVAFAFLHACTYLEIKYVNISRRLTEQVWNPCPLRVTVYSELVYEVAAMVSAFRSNKMPSKIIGSTFASIHMKNG